MLLSNLCRFFPSWRRLMSLLPFSSKLLSLYDLISILYSNHTMYNPISCRFLNQRRFYLLSFLSLIFSTRCFNADVVFLNLPNPNYLKEILLFQNEQSKSQSTIYEIKHLAFLLQKWIVRTTKARVLLHWSKNLYKSTNNIHKKESIGQMNHGNNKSQHLNFIALLFHPGLGPAVSKKVTGRVTT